MGGKNALPTATPEVATSAFFPSYIFSETRNRCNLRKPPLTDFTRCHTVAPSSVTPWHLVGNYVHVEYHQVHTKVRAY